MDRVCEAPGSCATQNNTKIHAFKETCCSNSKHNIFSDNSHRESSGRVGMYIYRYIDR